MRASDVQTTITDMRHEVTEVLVDSCIPENALPEQWKLNTLHEECMRVFGLNLPIHDWAKEEGIADREIHERIVSEVDRKMAEKAATYTPELMRIAEKSLLLQLLDQIWKDHLLQLDHLRQGIGLRAFAQRDPLNEYKREAFDMFQTMLARLRESVIQVLSHLELQTNPSEEALEQRSSQAKMIETRSDPAFLGDAETESGALPARRKAAAVVDPNDQSTWGRVSRNSACPCGSGRKYKQCHGQG
jgi:preprotein translocase subunit SecA